MGLIFLKYSVDHFTHLIKSLQWLSTVYLIKSKGLSLTFKTLYKMVLFLLTFALFSAYLSPLLNSTCLLGKSHKVSNYLEFLR